MKAYLVALRTPLLITAAVFLAGHTLDAVFSLREITPYLIVAQLIAMAQAGKRVVVDCGAGLVAAALAGMLIVLAVDVTLKVGWLTLRAMSQSASPDWSLQVRGVMAAFVVFSPLMLLCGYIGGVSGRREPD